MSAVDTKAASPWSPGSELDLADRELRHQAHCYSHSTDGGKAKAHRDLINAALRFAKAARAAMGDD